MNKQRRAELGKLMDQIEELRTHISELTDKVPVLCDRLGELMEEEQESFDNLPEGLQASERGTTMEEAIYNLETAKEALGELSDAVSNVDLDDILSNIDNARGQ